MSDNSGVVLFSGRFDKPHIGHIDTITALGQRYAKVIVVVLNYEKQMYPVHYRAQVLRRVLKRCRGEYEVLINRRHFGTIAPSEIAQFKFDVYCSGNMACLKHVESLGYPVEYVSRSDDISATDERIAQQIKDVIRREAL